MMDDREREILQRLDATVRDEQFRTVIDEIVPKLERRLETSSQSPLVWKPVPIMHYRDMLPPVVRSGWVFIIRCNSVTGAERHPNSHQRMMSYRGSGDLQIWDGITWVPHLLTSDINADLERRWISIPPNVWHQAVVTNDNWVVVSFHTVHENDLVEERPTSTDLMVTTHRKYVARGDL